MIEFRLPALGSDMDEGRLIQWLVQPGDAVRKGQVIAVVDTAKAAIDVECWNDGVVHRLVTETGQTVPVGTVMALLLAPGEAVPAPVAAARAAGTAPAAAGAATGPAIPAAVSATSRAAAAGATRQLASPAARPRAAELGLDLSGVSGPGPAGAVTRDDVERAAMQRPQAAAPAPPADRAAEMRRSIAAAMSRSKREIPHYYLSEAVPMRKALDWLRAANAQRPVTARLLPAALLLKAVAVAAREVAEMNGFYVDGGFRPSNAVHIGVAISLRQGGLIAPALHDVGNRTVDEVMRALADLVRRGRAGSLRSSEMSDPTITVTNLGERSVDSVFGVIYPPQVALVGFGRIGERPWAEDGRLTLMPVLNASLSADHRVSDGHRGARFLARLSDALQRPEGL
jgi:pyruvate dehydrogenase E2 component (dihydrolipoamide acetyltransferase)